MIGNAMYKPTSNASVLFPSTAPPLSLFPNLPSNPFMPGAERPGTTPPSVAARISSSVASQDFIFSAKLIDEDDVVAVVMPSPSPPSAAARSRSVRQEGMTSVDGVLLDGWWSGGRRDDDDDDAADGDENGCLGEKASDASNMAAAMRMTNRGIVGM